MYNSQYIPNSSHLFPSPCPSPVSISAFTNEQLALWNMDINHYFIQQMQSSQNCYPSQKILKGKQESSQSQATTFDLDVQQYAIQTQSTMPSLPQQGQLKFSKKSKKQSKKKNFPKLLTRKIAHQVKIYLMTLSQQQKNQKQVMYLSFWLQNKKQTRQSLQKFLIGSKPTSLGKDFAHYLQNDEQVDSNDMKRYRKYFRMLISKNREAILSSAKESKAEENTLFSQYVGDFIQDLQQSKMRGKAKKLFYTRE